MAHASISPRAIRALEQPPPRDMGATPMETSSNEQGPAPQNSPIFGDILETGPKLGEADLETRVIPRTCAMEAPGVEPGSASLPMRPLRA